MRDFAAFFVASTTRHVNSARRTQLDDEGSAILAEFIHLENARVVTGPRTSIMSGDADAFLRVRVSDANAWSLGETSTS